MIFGRNVEGGPAMTWTDRAELLEFFWPGIRSRNLTPFAYAVPIFGLENGPDFETVFATDRARIWGAVPANQQAGLAWGDWDGLGWVGWGE